MTVLGRASVLPVEAAAQVLDKLSDLVMVRRVLHRQPARPAVAAERDALDLDKVGPAAPDQVGVGGRVGRGGVAVLDERQAEDGTDASASDDVDRGEEALPCST